MNIASVGIGTMALGKVWDTHDTSIRGPAYLDLFGTSALEDRRLRTVCDINR